MVDKREENSKELLTRRVDWLKLSLIVVAFLILGLVLSGVLIYLSGHISTLPKTQ